MQSALDCKRFELSISLRKREMVDLKGCLVISVLASNLIVPSNKYDLRLSVSRNTVQHSREKVPST